MKKILIWGVLLVSLSGGVFASLPPASQDPAAKIPSPSRDISGQVAGEEVVPTNPSSENLKKLPTELKLPKKPKKGDRRRAKLDKGNLLSIDWGGKTYKVHIKEVKEGAVVIKVGKAGEEKIINVGAGIPVDLDGDGTDDVKIKVNATSKCVASGSCKVPPVDPAEIGNMAEASSADGTGNESEETDPTAGPSGESEGAEGATESTATCSGADPCACASAEEIKALSETERKTIQTKLQEAGFYKKAIDGDFGAGSVSAWNGYKSKQCGGAVGSEETTASASGETEAETPEPPAEGGGGSGAPAVEESVAELAAEGFDMDKCIAERKEQAVQKCVADAKEMIGTPPPGMEERAARDLQAAEQTCRNNNQPLNDSLYRSTCESEAQTAKKDACSKKGADYEYNEGANTCELTVDAEQRMKEEECKKNKGEDYEYDPTKKYCVKTQASQINDKTEQCKKTKGPDYIFEPVTGECELTEEAEAKKQADREARAKARMDELVANFEREKSQIEAIWPTHKLIEEVDRAAGKFGCTMNDARIGSMKIKKEMGGMSSVVVSIERHFARAC